VAQLATDPAGWHPFDEFRRERRRISLIALALALLLHLGLVVVLPEELVRRAADAGSPAEEGVELTLLPPETLSPEELRYVEANPEAPQNEPDRKDQYSFRAQQAADQNPDERLPDAPDVRGEEASQKIVEGVLQQAAPLEPGLYSSAVREGEGEGDEGGEAGATAAPPLAPAQPLPAPDFIRQSPADKDGPGSNPDLSGEARELTAAIDPAAPIEVYRPSEDPARQAAEGGGGGAEARPMPRERPRLAPELIQGPLMNSRGSAARRGTLAIDATFSEFGEYQQQFYAAIQVGWYQEIEFFQPIDTSAKVFISFVLHKDGSISKLEVLRSTASDLATTLCETAIQKRSPFRPWTKEMVEVFGDRRTLRVSFHYR